MRPAVLLMTMLLLTLFATVGFCEDGKMIVKNSADMPRVVKVRASVPTGYISKDSFIVARGGEKTPEIRLQRKVEYTERWEVKVLDVTGIPICKGWFFRDRDGFRLKTDGFCFTHEILGKDVVVTLTH